MKKFSQDGFVLAETLVVTVFLMVIFANIYTNFFPLIGEYEKRETYDDIDSEYTTYWIKKMIESKSFVFTTSRKNAISNNGYYKVYCKDFDSTYVNRECNDTDKLCSDNVNMCKTLVKIFQVDGCDADGGNCSIYLTTYKIFDDNNDQVWFKNTVKSNNGRVFSSGFQDYIVSLPDYLTRSMNGANYRVFVVYHNRKDGNNYYSYASLEVIK